MRGFAGNDRLRDLVEQIRDRVERSGTSPRQRLAAYRQGGSPGILPVYLVTHAYAGKHLGVSTERFFTDLALHCQGQLELSLLLGHDYIYHAVDVFDFEAEALGADLEFPTEHSNPSLVNLPLILASSQLPAQAAKVTWKMYLYTGAINPITQTMQALSKEVVNKTNGGFEIKVYPAKELPYSATQMPQIVRNRDVELADGLGGFIAGQLPLVGVFDQPFLITNTDQLEKAWKVAVPYLNKRLKRFKARVLFPYVWPAQNLWSTTAINKMSDIKGKKIRCTTGSRWN